MTWLRDAAYLVLAAVLLAGTRKQRSLGRRPLSTVWEFLQAGGVRDGGSHRRRQFLQADGISHCSAEEGTADPLGFATLGVRPAGSGCHSHPKMEPPLTLCRRFEISCLRKQQRHDRRQSAEPLPALTSAYDSENCHVPAGGTYSCPPSQADARNFNSLGFRPAILILLVSASAADLYSSVTAGVPTGTSLTAAGFRGSCKQALYLGAFFCMHWRGDKGNSERVSRSPGTSS